MTRKQVSRKTRKRKKPVGQIKPKKVAAHRLCVQLMTPGRTDAALENATEKEVLKFIGLSRNRALCMLPHRGSGEVHPMKGGPEFAVLSDDLPSLEGAFWMRMPELLALLDHKPKFFELDPDGDDEATIRHLLRDLVGQPEPKETGPLALPDLTRGREARWRSNRRLRRVPIREVPLGREARRALLDGNWGLKHPLLMEFGLAPWQDIDRRLLLDLLSREQWAKEDFHKRVLFVRLALSLRAEYLELSSRYRIELARMLRDIHASGLFVGAPCLKARGYARDALKLLPWMDVRQGIYGPAPEVEVTEAKTPGKVELIHQAADAIDDLSRTVRYLPCAESEPSMASRIWSRVREVSGKAGRLFAHKPQGDASEARTGYRSFVRWAGRSITFVIAAGAVACVFSLVILHVATGLPCLLIEEKKNRSRLKRTWKRLFLRMGEVGEKIFSRANRVLK